MILLFLLLMVTNVQSISSQYYIEVVNKEILSD